MEVSVSGNVGAESPSCYNSPVVQAVSQASFSDDKGPDMAFNPNVPIQAAIDFGISNTDAIAYVTGEWRRWTRPYTGQPDADLVRAILADGGVDLTALDQLAVTGGRHR